MDPQQAIEKLKGQNATLKSELQVLSQALEDATKKHRQQELQKQRVPQQSTELKDERERELRRILGKIKRTKNEIGEMKRQLDGNLNGNQIADLENEERYLNSKLKELEDENSALKKIETEQTKALDQINSAQDYPAKMRAMNDQIRSMRENYRELKAKQVADENALKVQHRKVIDLEEKCRKMKASINKKPNPYDEPKQAPISQADIEEYKNQCSQIEAEKLEEEKQLKAKIREVEAAVRATQDNIDNLNVQLKEKDQECRLNALRISELKRSVRHRQLKPLPKVDTGDVRGKTKSMGPQRNQRNSRGRQQPAQEEAEYSEEEN